MRYLRPCRVGVGALLLALLAAPPSQARQDAAPEAAVVRAAEAFAAGQAEAAIDALERVFEGDPAYVSAVHGAASYWLGRAYEAAADAESAREVWREGLTALDDAGRFDPRLNDAFVRVTFAGQHGEDYPLAARAYLQFIASVDGHPYDGEAADLLRAHLRALAVIAPDALRQQTGLDRLEARGLAVLAHDAGARLAAWWRSQDVAPATRNNERLEEHLRRLLYAEAHYRPDGDFDDRGRVYLRLGAPSRATNVPFDSMNLRNKVIDRSLTINASDFPENEFWYYEHIDEAAQFLFVKQGRGYRLGEVSDLLPSVLRNGLGSSERGRRKARAAVRTMDEIYRQLALYHPAFSARYQDVAAFASLLDEAEIAAQTAQAFQTDDRSVEAAGNDDASQALQDALAGGSASDLSSTTLPGAAFPADRPDLFAQRFLMQGHTEDEQLRLQREDYVPRSYSNAFDEVEPLPMLARVARFLDDDGTTRTEIYWGAPAGALHPSKRMRKRLQEEGYDADDYLLLTTIVQQAEDYRERAVHYKRYLAAELGDAQEAALAPQVYTVRGDTGLFHVALQWDQYTTRLDERGLPVSLGMAVKAATFRADTLRALRNDERILEMSDLKPMVMLDPQQAARADSLLENATLFPFSEIEAQTPLLLYFEVYHLAFDADDRTRFTVEYEMTWRREGTLLRRGREDRISAKTAYTGASRTARESILLDLKAWEGAGALDVVVRVTDGVTGRQVERMLPLTLVRR